MQVIDALMVTLGLDSSKFEAGTKKVDKSLGGITASATKFLAVIGGSYAMKRFIEDQIASSAALDRLSRNLNENASAVSAWSNAAEVAGGSASGLQGTLDMLSRAQTELQLTGQSGLVPYFSALGLSIADVNGRAKPTTQILTEMAERFSKMDRVTANNMGRSMGIDQGTMNLLLKGRTEVELLVKRQREQNAVTKVQAEQASRLQAAMIGSRQSFEAFGRELLSKATPALEKMFAVMADLGDWMRENREFVETFLYIIAAGLAAIGIALIPINLTATAVLGLAAAIALLWQDYQTFARGGDALAPWAKWLPGIKAAIAGIKAISNTLMDAGFRMAAFLDMTYEFYRGNKKAARKAAKLMMDGMPTGAADGGSSSSPGATDAPPPASFGAKAQRMDALEKTYGLPSGLLDSVWSAESNRGKNMKSPAGAEGHFQFMPGTAKQYGLDDPYDFNQSAKAAAMYYRDLLKKFDGNVEMAVAAYNWGPGNVDKKGLGSAPRETRDYMSRVLGGIPGAAMAARGAGAVPGASGGNSTASTTIGEIKVYTQATDAAGIAKDIGGEMDFMFTSQAEYGPT